MAASRPPFSAPRVLTQLRARRQGVLDEQFVTLRELQDEDNPEFVSEARAHLYPACVWYPARLRPAYAAHQMMNMYLDDSKEKVAAISRLLASRAASTRISEPPTAEEQPLLEPPGGAGGDNATASSPAQTGGAEVDAGLKELDGFAHQFKGGSASVGAPRVTAACVALREALKARDEEGMQRALADVSASYNQVRDVFTQLLSLEASLRSLGA